MAAGRSRPRCPALAPHERLCSESQGALDSPVFGETSAGHLATLCRDKSGTYGIPGTALHIVPAAAVATQVSGGEVNISFKSGFNVLDRFFLPTSGYISSASGKEIVLQVFSNEVTNVSGIDRLNLSMTAATAINTFPGSPAQGAASNARIAGTFSYIFETP